MTKDLIIVFVKNKELGKVKTRLAKTVGDEVALEVYSALTDITQNAVENCLDTDKHIYFSNTIAKNQWGNQIKKAQTGDNLGERMLNAFKDGFAFGYERIVLIGSDLPDISEKHLEEGLSVLTKKEMVFGPAEDGGYYLIGMQKPINMVFKNKPWSKPNLLETTLKELTKEDISYHLLEPLNDIDTYEDLIQSSLSVTFSNFIKLEK